jgi:hypothetical protein
MHVDILSGLKAEENANIKRTFASGLKTVRGEPVEPHFFTDECPSTAETSA